jgi:YD repeat-containing protein
LYDLAGNVTELIDANGHTHLTAYDALNRVTMTTRRREKGREKGTGTFIMPPIFPARPARGK